MNTVESLWRLGELLSFFSWLGWALHRMLLATDMNGECQFLTSTPGPIVQLAVVGDANTPTM